MGGAHEYSEKGWGGVPLECTTRLSVSVKNDLFSSKPTVITSPKNTAETQSPHPWQTHPLFPEQPEFGVIRFWKHSFACPSQMQHKITSNKWLCWKYDHKIRHLLSCQASYLPETLENVFPHNNQMALITLHKTKWIQFESWDFVSDQK